MCFMLKVVIGYTEFNIWLSLNACRLRMAFDKKLFIYICFRNEIYEYLFMNNALCSKKIIKMKCTKEMIPLHFAHLFVIYVDCMKFYSFHLELV